MELAFKAKAKSSALENYRKKKTSKTTKSPAKVEFKLRRDKYTHTINKNEQKHVHKLKSFSHTTSKTKTP